MEMKHCRPAGQSHSALIYTPEHTQHLRCKLRADAISYPLALKPSICLMLQGTMSKQCFKGLGEMDTTPTSWVLRSVFPHLHQQAAWLGGLRCCRHVLPKHFLWAGERTCHFSVVGQPHELL